MKRTAYILFLIFLCFLKAKGQGSEKYFTMYLNVNDTAFTYLDKNYLKLKPTDKSKTIAILNIGEELIIDSTFQETYYSNYTKPTFYKVKYKGKVGYLISESIAMTKLNYKKGETSFLFKLKSRKDSTNEIIIREVYRNRTIVNEFTTPFLGEMTMLYLADTKGLDSIDCLIVIDYISEACGMEGGVTYLSWTPKNIKLIAHLSSNSDSGVFYIDENLLFPNDSGGVKGNLLFKSEYFELLDEETNWYTKKTTGRSYRWINGQIFPVFKSNSNE